MKTLGRIVEKGEENFNSWRPEAFLPTISTTHLNLSRGFLQADFSVWFPKFKRLWTPFFHTLGANCNIVEITPTLEFPVDFENFVVLGINGELGVIGFDAMTEQLLIETVSPGCNRVASQVLKDYLQRRLVATLQRSWHSNQSTEWFIVPHVGRDEIELLGAVRLSFELNNSTGTLWFALGPHVIERFDELAREYFIETDKAREFCQTFSSQGKQKEESAVMVSVELAQLTIPPALLIDYVRGGTLIHLDTILSDEVSLNVNGETFWAKGRLGQFQGNFAVEVRELGVCSPVPVAGMTRVGIELADKQLSLPSLQEYAQQGAILLTDTSLQSPGKLVVAGERIASAVIGEIAGKLALHILP